MDCVLFVNDSARSLEHSYRLHVGQRHWNFINFSYALNVVGPLPRYSPPRLRVWVGDMKVEIYYYFFTSMDELLKLDCKNRTAVKGNNSNNVPAPVHVCFISPFGPQLPGTRYDEKN